MKQVFSIIYINSQSKWRKYGKLVTSKEGNEGWPVVGRKKEKKSREDREFIEPRNAVNRKLFVSEYAMEVAG